MIKVEEMKTVYCELFGHKIVMLKFSDREKVECHRSKLCEFRNQPFCELNFANRKKLTTSEVKNDVSKGVQEFSNWLSTSGVKAFSG